MEGPSTASVRMDEPDALSFVSEDVRKAFANWKVEDLKNAITKPFGGEKASVAPSSGINLSFHNLSYSVKVGIRRETKEILKGLHGEFRAGELTAIMGPSGAGKSSLLNVLAGYTVPGVKGAILLNGARMELQNFCSYILQDDVLPPMLTVEESMIMAAGLKSKQRSDSRGQIEVILESLGLLNCRKVLAWRLSGGQRKRLAIALELISDPPVMFFDEPTSGLDSSTSMQCIEVLKDLASSGRTIVCTIHQPSAKLFQKFDHVYVVAGGKCMYAGETSSMVDFLLQQKLLCPHYHNPADFILEVASMVEYKDFVPQLAEAIHYGKCAKWRKDGCQDKCCSDVEVLLEPSSSFFKSDISCFKSSYQASFYKQFCTLSLRSFRQLLRDQSSARIRLLIHIVMALLVGIIFYNIGDDAKHARNNFNLQFFNIMFIMFTSYASAVSFYPTQLPVLAREHFNNWYSLKSFYVAANFSEAPVQLMCTSIYFTIVYFMTSQPFEVSRFAMAFLVVALTSGVSEGIGYLVGCCMSITNASIFGPLVICPFIVFSGFFIKIPDAPSYFHWLFHLSYFKYAFHAELQSIYGMDRATLPCEEIFCAFGGRPAQILKFFGMNGGDYFFDCGILVAMFLLLRLLTYFSLVVKIHFLRK